MAEQEELRKKARDLIDRVYEIRNKVMNDDDS